MHNETLLINSLKTGFVWGSAGRAQLVEQLICNQLRCPRGTYRLSRMYEQLRHKTAIPDAHNVNKASTATRAGKVARGEVNS